MDTQAGLPLGFLHAANRFFFALCAILDHTDVLDQ